MILWLINLHSNDFVACDEAWMACVWSWLGCRNEKKINIQIQYNVIKLQEKVTLNYMRSVSIMCIITVWNPRLERVGLNEITENSEEWASWFCIWQGCLVKNCGASWGCMSLSKYWGEKGSHDKIIFLLAVFKNKTTFKLNNVLKCAYFSLWDFIQYFISLYTDRILTLY